MALITCPECGRDVSDKACACPSCAYPFQPTKRVNWQTKARPTGRFQYRPAYTLRFQNPINGHVVEVNDPGALTLVFGLFY